eukprot:COSAG02_NODE_789_length_17189_cov_23.034114_15_plen_69_part_00
MLGSERGGSHKRVVFGCMPLLKSLLARTQLVLETLQFSAPTTRVQLNLNSHALHLPQVVRVPHRLPVP